MSVFEHLMTLASFAIALGLAHLLRFAAVLILHRRSVIVSGPLIIWAIVTFMQQLTFWLGAYAFHTARHSSLPSITFVLLIPALLYLQGALLAPENTGDSVLDLREHHRRDRHAYLGVAALAAALNAGFLWYLATLNPAGTLGHAVAMYIATFLLCIAAIIFRQPAAQWLAALLQLVLSVTVLLFSSMTLVNV